MSVKLLPLAEQVIVITGASSGIGLVTARRAAAAGARVVLVARSEQALGEATRAINNEGGRADYAVADVGVAADVAAAAAKAIARFGRIDTWVNDAGVAIYAKLLDTPDDEHRRLFDTNYFGVVHGSLTAIEHLKRDGGAIVTVGSIASDIPSTIMGAYSAAKFAVKAYTQVLRTEINKAGLPIAVSLVKPSGIDTPIATHAAVHADGGRALLPPPVYAPELVADAILHCAVTGQREITVGGVGRLEALFAQHFKPIYEWLAPSDPAHATLKDQAQPTPSNLFEGDVRAGAARSPDQPGRTFSLYTAAAKRPGLTAAVVGGTLATAAALLFAGRRGNKE